MTANILREYIQIVEAKNKMTRWKVSFAPNGANGEITSAYLMVPTGVSPIAAVKKWAESVGVDLDDDNDTSALHWMIDSQ